MPRIQDTAPLPSLCFVEAGTSVSSTLSVVAFVVADILSRTVPIQASCQTTLTDE